MTTFAKLSNQLYTTMKHQLFLLLLLGWHSNLFALDRITLELGSVTMPGWQAENVVAQLQWRDQQTMALSLRVAKLILPNLKLPLTQLRLECPRLQSNPNQFACPQAQLYKDSEVKNTARKISAMTLVTLSFTYLIKSQRLEFRIQPFSLAGGNLSAQVISNLTQWQAEIKVNQLNLEQLFTQLATFIDLPTDFTVAGNTSLQLTVLTTTQVMTVNLTGTLNRFKYSNSAGTQAGENLAAQLTLQAQQPISTNTNSPPPPWHLQSTLTIQRGEIYSDPIYVEIKYPDPAVQLTTELSWQATTLDIHAFTYTHPNVMILKGLSNIQLAPEFALNQLTIQLTDGHLAEFYPRYLQTWLGDNQSISGLADGRLEWSQRKHYWQINLSHANLMDKQQRFQIQDLNGLLQWHNQTTELSSHLRWSQASLWTLKLKPSEITASFTGTQFKLLKPWQQPVLDGAITVKQFNLENWGQENLRWELSGKLTPITMQSLSAALGGPTLNGQLSADIPPLIYQNHQLSLAQDLRLQLFDGNVIIKTLKLLWGEVAELHTGIEFDKINLKTLTKITKFGEIQGHLSGYIRQLHLINWQPVSFDAYLATPEDNSLPKTISQKAIDNLSSLGGGGVVNTISKSMLRIFENFSYRRLGWGCLLRNGICQMRGVEKTKDGYYIVQGGGLPRIDVIGYNTQVDWNELLSRLKRISQVDAPVIK